MKQKTIIVLLAVVAGLFGPIGSPQSAQAQNTLAWTMDIYNWWGNNSPFINFRSQSRYPIVRMELHLPNTTYLYDNAGTYLWTGQPDGGSTTISQPSSGTRWTETLVVNFDSLAMEESILLYTDLDYDGCNCYVNFEDAFFSLDGNPNNNARLTVVNSIGQTNVFTLPQPTAYGSGWYHFESVNRPDALVVRSIIAKEQDAGGGVDDLINVGNVNVLIEDQVGFYFNQYGQRVPTTNIGQEVSIPVFVGEEILITAPEAVYWDAFGNDITADVIGGAGAIEDAMQRYLASGFSVNNVPTTGDNTLYRFNFASNTKVDVRWTHELALIIDHNFDQTQTSELDESGNPFAGPMSSFALGNPAPEAKKHWIKKGESVLATIDGKVLDYTQPGLDIRYVPTGYWGYGPVLSGSSYSNRTINGLSHEFTDFIVGQDPPSRQAIPEFVMDSFARIEYVWKIEFGVTVNVDQPSRASLPRIYKDDFQIGSGEGTYWINPNAKVFVACKANVGDWPGPALSEWFNGDGFYFSSVGKIDSFYGDLIEGGPVSNGASPIATWIPAFTNFSGDLYRGLEIDKLRRPVRVAFQYGDQLVRDDVTIGQHVFQSSDKSWLAERFAFAPDTIFKKFVTGSNPNVADTDMAVFDEGTKRLFPTVPGQIEAVWTDRPTGYKVRGIINAEYPDPAHYPHIADTAPVALDPDSSDNFIFQEMKYRENDASVNIDKEFTATTPGHAVLLFKKIQISGRGEPRQFLNVRVVETKRWDDIVSPSATVIIGQKITDPALDLAKLGTGYLYYDENVRYNPDVYDRTKLDGLAAKDVYNMAVLRALGGQKVVTKPTSLPGPVIPVNLHPLASESDRIVIIWYDDPVQNDELLWPHAARTYLPRWPVSAAEGLGRIVIASELGSESVAGDGADQVVVGAATALVVSASGAVVTNVYPAETTYNPSRLQQVRVYVQNDAGDAGYNPNEEHALMAPSLRYAAVSPRPLAAYALRNNDLNKYASSSSSEVGQPTDYTSHPYVLVEFFDAILQEYGMRVYKVFKEDVTHGYAFANQTAVIPPALSQEILNLLTTLALAFGMDQDALIPAFNLNTPIAVTPQTLVTYPHKTMEAGEPVIPFYPLVEVIGASPCPDTFGVNIKSQSVYWEDHKGGSWSVSGGENAWFTHSVYYPLAPDFWWPANQPGYYRNNNNNQKIAKVPGVGDCISFLPANSSSLRSLAPGAVVGKAVEAVSTPIRILYKSDWPELAPTLKAGETLTFAGGEYRADHPTTTLLDDNGDPVSVETPGLPGVLAFASAEVVFDSLNPGGSKANLGAFWTARVAPVLEVRRVILPVDSFPAELSPASGRTRVSKGKYVFNDLPASLQKRVRYNPLAQSVNSDGLTVNGKLEFIGLLNDKDIGDDTLTASPPAVYVLEPNIMTVDEKNALMSLDNGEGTTWDVAVEALYVISRNPNLLQYTSVGTVVTQETVQIEVPTYMEPFSGFQFYDRVDVQVTVTNYVTLTNIIIDQYLVGLDGMIKRDSVTGQPLLEPIEPGSDVTTVGKNYLIKESEVCYGPGLAVIPNGNFLDPNGTLPGTSTPYPDVSWVTIVENNDPALGGSPITPHVIRVDRLDRYRGAVKTVESDNVFDENLVLRHTGDFGANVNNLRFEWWYRPDDGQLNVPPPDLQKELTGQYDPWMLFPDPSGNDGLGRSVITLKGNPTAPEALLADTWWFSRYRHNNDVVSGVDWGLTRPVGNDDPFYTWAGAGNSEPFVDADLNGVPDFKAQLAMGWIKRVLDAVNPYEARIRDFEGDNPATVVSMISQFGARYEGPVALNPDKNVIENVGLIELYETVLNRGSSLSIDLSTPVSTPAIANALQLASTRISDFYTVLANEAYVDAMDPTIGFGTDSVKFGNLAPSVFSFQNQLASLLEEELCLLRGVDENFARPVYNRLFWNFTKGEGEAAYAVNYNSSDINEDGFVDEDDAMLAYPQGHGDAWGHYLTATKKQYKLFRHPYFNWVSRSEYYNLQDIPIKVDFLDERKFARIAAAKAKVGAEVVNLTYRDSYVDDPTSQWQGYSDSNNDRAWGVQEWARRAAQGALFDWVTANALLPAVHPNENLEGIQKVDRQENGDIAVISANLNSVQVTFDGANRGYNPLGIGANSVPFDINPVMVEDLIFGFTHFEQIYLRAVAALENAISIWDHANEAANRLRTIQNNEIAFRNSTFQEDLSYKNQLIQIFGKPYEGTIGSGKIFPAGYDGPDTLLYMYVKTREISDKTVPGPARSYATFGGSNNNTLVDGDIYDAWVSGQGSGAIPDSPALGLFYDLVASLNSPPLPGYLSEDTRRLFAASFVGSSSPIMARDGAFAVNYTDLQSPKVALENLTQLMPITASGYTFQAPDAWGSRGAAGELQSIISSMIQKEADIHAAIAAYDALMGELVRTIRLHNMKVDASNFIRLDNEFIALTAYIKETVMDTINTAKSTYEAITEVSQEVIEKSAEAIPLNLPTGGFAISPGDALAPARAAIILGSKPLTALKKAGVIAFEVAKLIYRRVTAYLEMARLNKQADVQGMVEIAELLKGVEDLIGDEPIKRINVFREIEGLRQLSDQFVAKLDEGSRLIDERAAYNKRVAAATQRERYMDMTFRVGRNHALQSYRAAFDLAAKYTFLAARAYDYETSLATEDAGSPSALYNEIVRARNLGVAGVSEPDEPSSFAGGGLSSHLAWLNANYMVLKGQLGVNNPQTEGSKISLRRELFRVLPSGETQPGVAEFPEPGMASDDVWRQTLDNARVSDLWEVPEFRYYCRPFADEYDTNGDRVPQPGLVLRFGTEIMAGRNVFGKQLSGGDHAYDPSVFSTKIRAAGVWFNNYLTEDIFNDLAVAPRVYLVPAGHDVMRISSGEDSGQVRYWNVVDQRIPVPYASIGSDLDQSSWIPLLDSLNGSFGEQRKFSSFRAYHNAGEDVFEDELVYDSRLIGRSVWNTEWLLIIPGQTFNADAEEGLNRFVDQVTDINLLFNTYGYSGN